MAKKTSTKKVARKTTARKATTRTRATGQNGTAHDPDAPTAEKAANISSDAVRAATGKTWPEWFHILDKIQAEKLKHKEIAAWLDENYEELGGWWSQMVTVAFEQERGLREPNEKEDGFCVNSTKTMDVAVGAIFRAWNDTRTRRKWLPDSIEIRKATKDKSMRVTWANGTHVDANFIAKGPKKAQITIQHRKLKSQKDVAKMRAYWGKRLDDLKSLLEAGG